MSNHMKKNQKLDIKSMHAFNVNNVFLWELIIYFCLQHCNIFIESNQHLLNKEKKSNVLFQKTFLFEY